MMVNAGIVNGETRRLLPPHFRENFPILGQILYFKNPFKYTRSFNVNHKTVHFAWNAA
jgi:hypothetical protein